MPYIEKEILEYLKEDLKSTLGPISTILLQRIGRAIGKRYVERYHNLNDIDEQLRKDGWYLSAEWSDNSVKITNSAELSKNAEIDSCVILNSIFEVVFSHIKNKRIFFRETHHAEANGDVCSFEITDELTL